MEHRWYTQHNRPVIRNFGLIIGKNKIPLEKSIVSMLKQYGFKREEAEQSLNANKHNQVTTIYYLLHKRYEKLGQLPSHFNIMKRSSKGDSAERQAENVAPTRPVPQHEAQLKRHPTKMWQMRYRPPCSGTACTG